MTKGVLAFLLLFSFYLKGQSYTSDTSNNRWVYRLLSINRLSVPIPKAPLIIAVVDDGFRLTHVSLKNYFYVNEREKPDNLIDDDKNGYIDDSKGWDISDGDFVVGIPPGREKTFYHGTYLTSIIAEALEQCLGEEAYRHVKIMPIKVLADQSKTTYLADGYKGVQYAVDNGAKIICCAWSGGQLSVEQRKILEEAQRKGVLIVNSVGNLSSERTEGLAPFPNLLSIAAIDQNMRKTRESNYGMQVDFSCPGKRVKGASSLNDTSYLFQEGTSPATALATACLSALMATFPTKSLDALVESLMNTAKPIDSLNNKYAGKLGAGIPQFNEAYNYLLSHKAKPGTYKTVRPKEILYLGTSCSNQITLAPYGHFKSIRLEMGDLKKRDLDKKIQLIHDNSIWLAGKLSDFTRGLKIPFDHIDLKVLKNGPSCIRLTYFVETIDSSSLYCDKSIILESEDGTVTDGSGPNANYANKCDCQWQISVTKGKRIRLSCDSLDTEPNTDFVWIFDGTMAIPENLIAKFSGNSLPPIITSRTSDVLIWFVSNEQLTRKGWKLRYETVD